MLLPCLPFTRPLPNFKLDKRPVLDRESIVYFTMLQGVRRARLTGRSNKTIHKGGNHPCMLYGLQF
jgi:hypothetical protein